MMHNSFMLHHDLKFTPKLFWQIIIPVNFGVLVNKTINSYLNVRKHLTVMRVDTGYAYGLLMNTCEFGRACSRLQHVFFPQVYCYTFVTVNSGSRVEKMTYPTWTEWKLHKTALQWYLAEIINNNKEWPMNVAEWIIYTLKEEKHCWNFSFTTAPMII